MKRILSLLSLSGMLFADQAIVITFGKTLTNSQEQNSQEQISTDTLTYNKITANSDYPTDNFCYTDGSGSQISARFVNEGNINNISTARGAITLTDRIEPLSNVFGNATIDGVLISTDSHALQIMFKGLDSGNYTLYAFAARGDNPTPTVPTYYFLSSVTDIKASVIAEANSKYEVLDSSNFSTTNTPTITARTYNDDSKITRWALMKFDFSVKDGTEQVIFNSANNGNIAAIALVEHSTPEPTTTTLSLLTLATLTARRRRK